MSLPALAIGAVVGGGLLSAGSKIKEGNAAYSQGMYQAQVSERNKQIADINAANAIAEGQVAETAQRRQVQQMRGQDRAVAAGLGQLLDAGTAGQIEADTAQTGEADALQIRRNAEKEALGFTIQGQNFGTDAVMQRSAAKSARTAGFISGFGTLLGSAGKAYAMNSYFKGNPGSANATASASLGGP